jgi:hypothetical protein
MICVTPARKESRTRDKDRKRLLLSLGRLSFHITRAEARLLILQLRKELK